MIRSNASDVSSNSAFRRDTVPLYANWQGRGGNWEHIPDTTHYDLSAYHESFGRLERIGGTLLPAHDFQVLERQRYG